ncbi:MAG TPA: hypothetical protein VI916_01720 [Acidimicrobiia bacterium]|nr:hypothetical protein [Acidimicrobiia bacterium]
MTNVPDDPAVAEMVDQLRAIEERLRDLAYDRLREAVESGHDKAPPEQRRIEQARRAVARALHALAPDGLETD